MDGTAKELLHIEGWLERVDEIVERGKEAYIGDEGLDQCPSTAV